MTDAQLTELFDRIHKLITDQNKKIDQIQTLLQPIEHNDRQELYTALALAQSEFKVARRSREEAYYNMRYETIADIMEASRPYLSKNGLSVIFTVTCGDSDGAMLTCNLLHSSGQAIESKMRLLPSKNDPKSFQSEMSFMKRILYSGITGVVADDEDDDAAVAMADFRDTAAKGVILTAKPDVREDRTPISKDQYEELEYELSEYPDITEDILSGLKIRDLASMPKAKYPGAIRRIRGIKDLRNNKR